MPAEGLTITVTTGTEATTVTIGTETTGRKGALTNQTETGITVAAGASQTVMTITAVDATGTKAAGAGIGATNLRNPAEMITTAGEEVVCNSLKTKWAVTMRTAQADSKITASIYIKKAIPVNGVAFLLLQNDVNNYLP
jgi:hypothetical protein